jgi:formylglycine-generating enzyme required for sulfatase activity
MQLIGRIEQFSVGRLRYLVVATVAACAPNYASVNILSGTYTVGLNSCSENPRRSVTTSGFRIDRFEATVLEYQRCVAAQACPLLTRSYQRKDLQKSIVPLTYSQAYEYCRWRGARIPTNEEWEIAARGRDERIYPWGNEYSSKRLASGKMIKEYDVGIYSYFEPGSAPAGNSESGISDLAGTLPEFSVSRSGKVYLRGATADGLITNPRDVLSTRMVSNSSNYAAVRCVW